jgi:membrane protein involved in colicin uptake
MKKLFALMAAGGLLALTTGCPPAPSTGLPPTHATPGTSAGTSTGTHENGAGDHNKADKAAADKAAADKAADKAAADKAAADKSADKAAADKAAADKAAADKNTPEKPIAGKVTKIDKDKLTVDGKDVTVPADAEVWIDGKKDELKNVKDGNTATVTEKDGKVTKVEVKTK